MAGIFVGALGSAAPGMAAEPEAVYGLTATDDLAVFSSDKPGSPSVIDVTGVTAGDNLVGIDFRPATGQLYGLAKVGATTDGRVYRIDPASGDATVIGAVALTGVVTGAQQGFDFNPVPDRIRLVNDEPDSNARINPDTGALAAADTPLAYAPGDPNVLADPNVEAVAYTNSIGGSAATRLFGIDTSLDVLTQFGPGNADPNNGAMTTRGPLGVNVDAVAGFDIAPGGSTALAALRPTGATRPKLYAIDAAGPTAGSARELGTIGSAGATPGPVVDDIAIAPSVREFAALTNGPNQQLFTFFSDAPGDTSDPVNLTGLPGGTTLVGIDTRPANGQLVGVGDDERLYRIDPDTGQTSVVGTGPFSPALTGTGFGVDFNPVPDRLRVTSTDEQNLRINPDTGVGAGAAPPSAADTALTNPADLTPDVVGSAYTNSEPGAANTTLYGVDSDTNQLVRQGDVDGAPASPNGGTLTNVGAALGVDVDSALGYDIVPEDNQGFIATDDVAAAGVQPNLYSVNPSGGQAGVAINAGAIGAPAGKTVVGLAFLDETVVSLVSASQTVGEGDGSAIITLTRDGDLDRTATATVRTANGSATAPQDFGALTNATVTFAPGETVKTVSVPINNDTADEPNEAFGVVLSPVTGRAGNNVTLVKIADDDNPPGGGGGGNGGGGNVVNGTSGNDTINGTSGNDVINCGDGNDVVNGGGGDDVINCGGGNDRIRGGSGDDRIDGGSGNDRIDGNSGDDRIDGGSGNDRISGGSGDDRISGGSGNDRISGGNGRDRLSGNSGRDSISGGDGNDRLSGGSGNDRLNGGSGRDRLSGGPGRDRSRQ